MQLQVRKRVAKHEPDGFRHVTTTRVRSADKITKIGVPKSAQKDLTEIDRADNPSIFYTTNEETSGIGAATTFEKRSELRAFSWRRYQAAMQLRAGAIERKEFFHVAARRCPEIDTLTSHDCVFDFDVASRIDVSARAPGAELDVNIRKFA